MKTTRFGVLCAAVICLCFVSGCATTGGGSGVVYDGRAAAYGAQQQYAAPQPQGMPTASQSAPEKKKYLKVGADAVNPHRKREPNERIFPLTEDVYVATLGRSGKISQGWLHKGERVFVVRASDPRYWEATIIKRCGNPIVNRVAGIAPIWILDPMYQQAVPQGIAQQQPAVMQGVAPQMLAQQSYQQYAAPQPQQPVPCEVRKSGWGSVLGGIGGLTIGVLTRNKVAAVLTSAGGSLIGGYIDGECITGQDLVTAAGFGIGGAILTHPRAQQQYVGHATGAGGIGPAPLPSNGLAGGIPGN